MRSALVLAALLTLTLAAGCIGAPGKTMTARDGLEDAEDAAKEWADGADLRLIAIVAVEPFKRINHTSADGSESGEFITHLDGNPGDGRAPGWGYGFLAGDRCVGVVLAAGLGVLAEGYETCFDVEELTGETGADADEIEQEMTVGDWSVDSDEAATRLHEHEDWPDTGEDWTFFWALVPGGEEAGALWIVEGSGQEGTTVEAVLNAETGEVVEIEVEQSGFGFFGPVDEDVPVDPGSPGSPGTPGSSGSNGFTMVHDEGRADVITPVMPAIISVDLEGDGGFLIAQATVAATANVVGQVEVVLYGPDGIVERDGLPNFTGGAVTFELMALPPGTYTLSVESNNAGAVGAQAQLVLDGGWS